MHRTLYFDLDNTLTPMQDVYTEARQRWAAFTRYTLGDVGTEEELIAKLDTVIGNDIKEHGFYTEQFPQAMQDVYKQIAWEAETPPNPDDVEHAYTIGADVLAEEPFYADRGLLPGVEETLDYLQEHGDELVLFTKGDPTMQSRKIAGNDLSQWFDEAYIVPEKNRDVVEQCIGDRDKSRIWMIGDSLRSDITPALEAGIGAVHIPADTWSYETADIPEEHPRFFTADEITELIQLRDTVL